MKIIRWGILGLGNIAEKFASDLLLVPHCILQAVASQRKNHAAFFAKILVQLTDNSREEVEKPEKKEDKNPVSYTHLTLPTNREV